MIPMELLQDQNPWWTGPVKRALDYPVRRDLQQEILSRLLHGEDRRATLLLGPRQVGKTVLLLQMVDDLLAAGWPPHNLTYFDFSDDRLTEPLSAREVAESLPNSYDPGHPRVLLLDEIRLASKWDLWLKQAVDHGVGRIVATDSAASLLRDGARESGQGRWNEVVIEGLSLREFVKLQGSGGETVEEILASRPALPSRYLALGGFPEYAVSANLLEARRRLRSDIADRAILRDLSRLGLDIQRVKDLFVYLVQDSGAELNAEARSRDLGADPRTVRDWVRLLGDTLLVHPLERRHQQAAAGLRSKVKLYASDPGLVSAFALSPIPDARTQARALEAAVFLHLRELARRLDGRLTYFRQREDLEIDFVLEAPGLPVSAIEVTSSLRVRPEKLDRLRQAGGELGAERLFLVHGGVVGDAVKDPVRTVSWTRFLLDPQVTLEDGRA